MTHSLHLVVPLSLSAISDAGEQIEIFLRVHDVGRSDAYDVRLASVEVMTNIVRHGFPSPAVDSVITARVDVMPEVVRVRIEDEGAEPPLLHPRSMPEISEDLQRVESGRGIVIVQSVMHSVECLSAGERNVIEMTKRLTPRAAPAVG